VGPELMLLLVRACVEFSERAQDARHASESLKKNQIGVFLGSLESTEQGNSDSCSTSTAVPPQGQRDEWKALKLSVKAANVPKWAQHSQESIWESGGKWKMGQESE
jgi:hypothetical protein